MTHILKVALFVFAIGLISCSKKEDQEIPKLNIGISQTVINPPIGSFIAGDKQNRKFEGIKDSLYVKATVFSDGKEAFALVTIDCIGLMYPELLSIREAVGNLDLGVPLNKENIVISSTHTHSGPDVVGLWGKDYTESGVDQEYLANLIKTTASQIQAASKKMIPTKGSYATTTFGHDWVANICNEEIDRSVTVLQFSDLSGNNLLSLTNFACHPTYLDAVFKEVSADYIAGFYREMDDKLGGQNMFFQGAIGGWVQPIDKDGDYIHAIQRGQQLAESTLSALDESKPLQYSDIHFHSKKISLPVENMNWVHLAKAGIVNREIDTHLTTEVAWFGIGEATFATHPGETPPAYGLETKSWMPDGPTFILGLSQDAIGYILKPVYFDDQSLPHAAYLTSMSLGPKTGPIFMDALKELSNKAKP